MSAQPNLITVSYLCSLLQHSYREITEALNEIGAEPTFSINGVPHYGDEVVGQIKDRFAQLAGTREA